VILALQGQEPEKKGVDPKESTPKMQGKQGEERPDCPPSETRWTFMLRAQTLINPMLCWHDSMHDLQHGKLWKFIYQNALRVGINYRTRCSMNARQPAQNVGYTVACCLRKKR